MGYHRSLQPISEMKTATNQWTLNKIPERATGRMMVSVKRLGRCPRPGAVCKERADMGFLHLDRRSWWALPMPTTTIISMSYMKAIQEGKFTQKELDDKVRAYCASSIAPRWIRNRPHGFLCSESHYAAARQIAEEGIIAQNRNNVPHQHPEG